MTADTSRPPRPLPRRMPRVCVAVAATSGADMVARAESLVRDNPFLEFRLDYLKNPSQGLAALKRFLSYRPECIAVATCRRAVNGGKFRGSAASQLSLLAKAAAAGCQLVDVELQTAASVKPAELAKLHARAAIILSYHDFRGTRKLDETFAQMQKYSADIYKLVSTANSLYDNVLMMKFLERHGSTHPLVGLCMGEHGIISRILAVRAGSAFTFASAMAGEETAPGQIAASVLRSVYRIEQVDAATRVYGVAGNPVAQSLSPRMMNAAFRRENVNAVFVALWAKELDDLLLCVQEIPVHGASITMPYKQALMPHLDNSDVPSQKIGACNTLVRAADGKLYGFNTDMAGVVAAIEQRVTLPGLRVLVIGAGGAARAAVFGLRQRGAEVFILNRTPAKAQKLARQAQAKTIKRADLKKLLLDVIINATPLGMGGNPQSPLNQPEIKARYVMDMVYRPLETRFLQLARAAGAQVIPGMDTFVHQGARQFEIWTGKPAPLAEMQNEVTSALEAESRPANGRDGKNGSGAAAAHNGSAAHANGSRRPAAKAAKPVKHAKAKARR